MEQNPLPITNPPVSQPDRRLTNNNEMYVVFYNIRKRSEVQTDTLKSAAAY